MNDFMSRPACLPARLSVFGFVKRLMRVGLLYVAMLLGFSGMAWGGVPQEGDREALVTYNAGCSTPPIYSSLNELVDACKAKILFNQCLKPGCVLNSFFVGEQYSPCTGYPANPVQSINGVPHPGRCGYGNRTWYSSPAYTTIIPSLTGNFFYFSTGIGYLCPPNHEVKLGDNHTNQNKRIYCRPLTPIVPPPGPQCPSSSPNNTPISVFLGNPIDLTTGIKIQPETDYAGTDGLSFTRTYRSSTGRFESILTSRWSAAGTPGNLQGSSGAFYNWTTQVSGKWFNAQLPIMSGDLTTANHYLYTPDGQYLVFSEDSLGNISAKADTPISVVKNPDTASQNVWLWELTREDDSHERYNNQGQLTVKWTRSGLTTTYTYSDANTAPAIAPRSGLLIRITNAYGRSLNFSYTSNSQLATLTDPAGGVYRYAYTDPAAFDNLTSVTYPDGKTRTYVYNETAYLPPVSSTVPNPLYPHALTGIIDENNTRYATFAYDNKGRAVTSKHHGTVNNVSGQDVERYNFNFSSATHTQVTNPLGAVHTYSFSSILKTPRITGTNQPGGAGCNAVTYDSNGNISSRTDFNGNQTVYTYDLSHNLETSRSEGLTATGATTAATRAITTEWHPSLRLPVKITQPGQQTTWVYDEHGHITQKTRTATATGASRTWTTAYSYSATVPGVILQKTEDGPRSDVSDVTVTDYYPPDATCTGGHLGCRGRISQITNALGHVTQISRYNAHGQPEQTIDANGLVTTLAYDARQRLISRTAGDETTTLHYDSNGQLTQLTRPDAGTLNYSYDSAHRLTQISDSLGNRINYTLDAMGNRIREDRYDPSNQLSQTQRREYDPLNRLAKSIGADNQTSQYGYDAQGNLSDQSDPLGHATGHDYDALNRLVHSIDPDNGHTTNNLDARDNLIAVTDPRNNSTHYRYDGLNNLSSESSPDRGTLNYTYDEAGNLITRTDARGVTQTYSYDALNRPLRKTHSTVEGIAETADITWHYDQDANGIGHLTTMTDESGSTAYNYDNHGRLISKTQTTTINSADQSHTLHYSYDSAGRLNQQTYPSGLQITYNYDAQGNIGSLSLNGQPLLSTIAYQPFGQAKSWTWSNGQVYTRSFDSDGRIAAYPLQPDNRTLTYDAAGRITAYSHSSTANNRNFDYDALDRLSAEISPTGSQTYSYDASSNRSAVSIDSTPYSYSIEGISNRLLSSQGPSPKSYSYDASGNTTGDGHAAYTWNAAGRLSQAVTPSTTINYRHNGSGERVIKTGPSLNNGPHRYLYDPSGHLIGEYDQNNTVRQETVWLGDTPVAVVKPDPNTKQPQIYFIEADHLNTPRVILNSAHTPIWRWDSDAFGQGQPDQDPDGDGQTFEYNLRFPGQYYDKETGLHYNYNRDYDPGTGRYIESDPIGLYLNPMGEVEEINTYIYALNDPLRNTDPLGQSIIRIGGVSGTAACMKIKLCREALERAIKFCKNTDCKFEWHVAHHHFPGLGWCEHYSLTCWEKGVGLIFRAQWPFPGRCVPNRPNGPLPNRLPFTEEEP